VILLYLDVRHITHGRRCARYTGIVATTTTACWLAGHGAVVVVCCAPSDARSCVQAALDVREARGDVDGLGMLV
jgi:hypothetical protein